MISEAIVQLPSIDINYQIAGQDDAPVILLLHGLGTRASFWQPVVHAIVAAGYRVYALDLPGFGHSATISDLYSPARLGKLISSFVEVLGLAPAIVIGHSMGGTMAGGFALANPASVKALVFVDAFGFSNQLIPVSPGILSSLALPSLYYRLKQQPEKLIKPIIESNFRVAERLSPQILEMAIAENWVGNASERTKILYGLGASLGFPAQRRRYRNSLRQIFLQYQFPIMVIWGQEDRFLPVSGAYQIKSEIPEITLQIIPDCGHVPPLEKTDEFTQLVTQFVRTLE